MSFSNHLTFNSGLVRNEEENVKNSRIVAPPALRIVSLCF